jgi:hypothetical protein
MRSSSVRVAETITRADDAPRSNWLPAPDGNFSLYIRAYWGKEAILDGTWQPPEIEVVQ